MYVNIVHFILYLTVTPNKPDKKAPEKKMDKSFQSGQRPAGETAPDNKPKKRPVEIVMQVLQHVSASY